MGQELNLENNTLQLNRLVKHTKQAKVVDPNRDIKRAIWLYFWLLIFEGALRKWFLPGLSTPLLVVRDPIALYIVLAARNRGLLLNNIYLFGMVSLGILGVFTALAVGHGNLPVAIYGARIFLFHFPMIFVIGRVFKREDVIRMGKITLWISLPMIVLIALQFYSPQSAWVNRGLGDDVAGAGFAGALGYFRPPGTFSFTTGNTLFFSFAASFALYFLFDMKNISRVLLIGSVISVIASIPFSISRSLTFQIALSVAFAFFALLRNPQNLGKGIFAIVLVGGLLMGLSNTSTFQTATGVLTARFTNAETTEGGLEGTFGDRYLGGMISTLSSSTEQPFFGYGIGMGTKVGAQLLTGTRKGWLIAEGEWGRVIGEMGPLMGLSVILLRIGLCIKITVQSVKKLGRGDMLPWMLLSFGLAILAQGSWAQPTSLGFCVVIGGLMIASLNNSSNAKQNNSVTSEKIPIRGRATIKTMNY